MNFEDKVKKQYTGNQGKAYHDAKHVVPEAAEAWIIKHRAGKMSPFITEQNTVLEYGCGTGWNIAGLECRKRLGYDIAEHLESHLKQYDIEFIKDMDSVADESIDVAICHHVLEHVAAPPDVLQEIRRILCKRGKALLFTPYETGKKYHRYDSHEPNHHLYSWNVQTLGNLVEKCGFKVFKGSIGRFGYDRFAGVWAEKFHLGESGFILLKKLIHFIKPEHEVVIVALKE